MAFENALKRKGSRRRRKTNRLPRFTYEKILGVDYSSSIYARDPQDLAYGLNCDMGNPIGRISKAPGFEALHTTLGVGGEKGLVGWPHSTGDKMLAAWGKGLYVYSGESGSVAKSTQADWEAGTLTDIDTTTSPGDIKIAKGTDYSNTATLTADFSGTHSSTEAVSDKVQLTSVGSAAYGISSLPSLSTDSSVATYNTYGYKFTVGATAILVDKLRAYSPTAETRAVKIWTTGGTLLASASVSCTANTWSEASLATPLTLSANTAYLIGIEHAPGNSYYGPISGITLNGLFTINEGRANGNSAAYHYPDYAYATNAFGIVDLHAVPSYAAAGTYTHVEQDVSAVGIDLTATITFNTTTPTGTAIPVQTQYTTDGTTWSDWTTRASGDAIIPAGTDLSNGGKVNWRVQPSTTDLSVTPSLNDVTIAITAGYQARGVYLSEVIDLGTTPTENTISFTNTVPANTTATWSIRGSASGTNFGDWQSSVVSGDAIPLQRYIQIQIELETTDVATTPTVSDLLMSFSTSYTVPNKLDIGPLGRVNNELTGNRLSMITYEDWCLCADGLRPFLIYITTATQRTGTAAGGAAGYIQLDGSASAIDDFYNNAFVTITGGTGAGQIRYISDYTGSNKRAVPSVNFNPAPDATSTFSIGSAVKVRNLGVDPPVNAPTVADSGSSGSPNGAYSYKVTLTNADGVEGNPSPAASITVSSKQITVTKPTGITDSTITHWTIYRTVAGGSVYKLLAKVAIGTGTYTDNTADGGLGILMYDNNNIPPNTSFLYQFTGYVFFANGYDLWFSKVGYPDQVPNISGDIQVIVFPGRIGDIKNHPAALIVTGPIFSASFTSNSGFIFDSDPSVDTTTMKIIDSNGGLSWAASAMCLSPDLRSTLVMNTNTGLRSVVPGLQENSIESIPLSYKIQPYYDRSINRDQAAGVFFRNYYLYSMEYLGVGGASERLTFAYDFRTSRWYGPWEFGMSCYAILGNELYAGDADSGIIYHMFTGHTYAGRNIHMIADEPMMSPSGEQGTYTFEQITAILSGDSVTTDTYLKPKVDDTEEIISLGTLSTTFTGDRRPGHDIMRSEKYPMSHGPGHTFSLRIEDDSGNWISFEKIITEYEELDVNW